MIRIPAIDTITFYLEPVARLVLACILGGLIGYERENMHRPAGFRTNILVCVGAALVMITSEFIFKQYRGMANMDPARLGAQVISGIGFLGAGTIIREGFSVKGLTTAASLWAVSCVGIAVGIGFYQGAVAATILIYLTLIALKRLEIQFLKKNHYNVLLVKMDHLPGQTAAIICILEKQNVEIRKIEYLNNEGENSILMKLLVKFPSGTAKGNTIDQIYCLEGIQKVFDE